MTPSSGKRPVIKAVMGPSHPPLPKARIVHTTPSAHTSSTHTHLGEATLRGLAYSLHSEFTEHIPHKPVSPTSVRQRWRITFGSVHSTISLTANPHKISKRQRPAVGLQTRPTEKRYCRAAKSMLAALRSSIGQLCGALETRAQYLRHTLVHN